MLKNIRKNRFWLLKALETYSQALSDAGFTVKDEQVIKSAVEKAYAQQRDLLKQYPQKEKED